MEWIESQEVNPCVCGQQILTKAPRSFNGEIVFSTDSAGTIGQPHIKNQFRPLILGYYIPKLTWVKDPNVNSKTVNLLEENMSKFWLSIQ